MRAVFINFYYLTNFPPFGQQRVTVQKSNYIFKVAALRNKLDKILQSLASLAINSSVLLIFKALNIKTFQSLLLSFQAVKQKTLVLLGVVFEKV